MRPRHKLITITGNPFQFNAFSFSDITCNSFQFLGKDKGKKGAEPAVAPPPEPETLTEEGEPPEPPPKTYVTKDRFEYFKPQIQVNCRKS